MFQILFKYLLLNKQVNIPGIGELKLVQEPAKINLADMVVNPPASIIQFNNVSATADKNFFRFASGEMQVEDWKTISRFHEFLFKLKSSLDSEQQVDLPSMGVLKKDENGKVYFEQEPLKPAYFGQLLLPGSKPEYLQTEAIEADPVALNANLNDTQPKATANKNAWWIAALIIAVLAIAAIVYYYYINTQPAF